MDNRSERDAAADSFFNERIVPLSELARSRAIELFPLGFDENASSYFVERTDKGDYIHEVDANAIAGELRKVLNSEFLPEMGELADALEELAAELRETDDPQNEISPFIYAMF